MCGNSSRHQNRGLFQFQDELLIAIGQPNQARANEVMDEAAASRYPLGYLFSYERTAEWIHKALGSFPHHIAPVQDIFDTQKYEHDSLHN